MTTAAQERLVAPDLLGVPVAPDGASQALATATAELGAFAGCEVGLWEAGPGVDVDVEVDELFVVLSGQGRVTFEDGSVIELVPGTLVHLRAGDRTTWTIESRIRKLYLIGS